MDDQAIAELRKDDPDFEPTALDRALYDLGVRLMSNGFTDGAERVATASSVLHYAPLSPKLDEPDLRTLYDSLSSLIMAAATIATEINGVLSVLSAGNGHDE